MPSATYDHLKIAPLDGQQESDRATMSTAAGTAVEVMDTPAEKTSLALASSSSRVVVPANQNTSTNVCVQLVESNANPTGVALVDPHRTNKSSDPSDLVELARQIQSAESFVRARAHGRLGIIAEQMRFLQDTAAKVLTEAKRDDELHHMACNMVKKPGNAYYCYRRQSGQDYLSLISPQEWGAGLPHQFLGAYRLEADQSWTPIEDLAQRSKDIEFLDSILQANKTLVRSIEGPVRPMPPPSQ